MPQLMPLGWWMSSFVVVFMLVVMWMVYFDVFVINESVFIKGNKSINSWKW